MKTTIEIASPLLVQARALAASEKTTLRALIEEGLREVLQRRRTPPKKPFKFRDASVHGDGLTPEMEARGGWKRMHEAAYDEFWEEGYDDQDKK